MRCREDIVPVSEMPRHPAQMQSMRLCVREGVARTYVDAVPFQDGGSNWLTMALSTVSKAPNTRCAP